MLRTPPTANVQGVYRCRSNLPPIATKLVATASPFVKCVLMNLKIIVPWRWLVLRYLSLMLTLDIVPSVQGQSIGEVENWHICSDKLQNLLIFFIHLNQNPYYSGQPFEIRLIRVWPNGTVVTSSMGTHRLISLGSTVVTSVGRYHHHRFYFSAACHYSTNCHQLSNILSLHISYRHRFPGCTVFEVNFTKMFRTCWLETSRKMLVSLI